MSFVTHLKCAKCGTEYSLDDKLTLCPKKDDGRLDIYYDYEAISKKLNKKTLQQRNLGLWNYKELLPVKDERKIVTLGEGRTPLILSKRLAGKWGTKNLYLKDETRSPTGSFKDRAMTVGVSKALEYDIKTVATASSGNAAAALAAYSARAGLDCYAFVLDIAPIEKIAQLLLLGAKVLAVKGLEKGEDPTVKMLRMVVEKYGWYPCPSFGPFNPYQVEGPKTISYEIIEQMDWKVPDWVLVSTGASCLLTGIYKGFKDFQTLGFIDNIPKLVAVQAEGNAPLVRAYQQNKGPFEIQAWEHPNTVAGGLSDPFPWDGDIGLKAIRESGGTAISVPDKEILEAQKILASHEGVFAEPSGVTSLAGCKKLLDDGIIRKDDVVVVPITGTGLKDPGTVLKMFRGAPKIEANIKEFEKAVADYYSIKIN